MNEQHPRTVDEATRPSRRPGDADPGNRALTEDALPPDLRSLTPALRDATAGTPPGSLSSDGPSWPEAEQPRLIAEVLIDGVPTHQDLAAASIYFAWRDGITRDGAEVLGRMDRVGAKWREIAGFDFVMQIDVTTFRFMSPAERVRLVDHELCHAAVEDGEPQSVAHDVEEFTEIVNRWGRWHRKPALNDLLKRGAQGDLFETR